MATNSYFRSNYNAISQDQLLIQDLIIESIQIYGIDMIYIPRTFVNEDKLYGEDQSSAFNKTYTIEFYIKSIDGFGGDDEFLSRFGIEIRDEVQLSISIKRFTDTVTVDDQTISRPKEGDLIYLPVEVDKRQRLYEISFVDDEEIFYQLGNLYTYEVRCKLFEYGGESFDTGTDVIDSIESTYSNSVQIQLNVGNGDFASGETAFQGVDLASASYSAEVITWDSLTNELTVIKPTGDFDETSPIIGDTSGANWTVTEIESELSNDGLQDNDILDDLGESFIDSSTTNRFSE